jgi:hypothetical protein
VPGVSKQRDAVRCSALRLIEGHDGRFVFGWDRECVVTGSVPVGRDVLPDLKLIEGRLGLLFCSFNPSLKVGQLLKRVFDKAIREFGWCLCGGAVAGHDVLHINGEGEKKGKAPRRAPCPKLLRGLIFRLRITVVGTKLVNLAMCLIGDLAEEQQFADAEAA